MKYSPSEDRLWREYATRAGVDHREVLPWLNWHINRSESNYIRRALDRGSEHARTRRERA